MKKSASATTVNIAVIADPDDNAPFDEATNARIARTIRQKIHEQIQKTKTKDTERIRVTTTGTPGVETITLQCVAQIADANPVRDESEIAGTPLVTAVLEPFPYASITALPEPFDKSRATFEAIEDATHVLAYSSAKPINDMREIAVLIANRDAEIMNRADAIIAATPLTPEELESSQSRVAKFVRQMSVYHPDAEVVTLHYATE